MQESTFIVNSGLKYWTCSGFLHLSLQVNVPQVQYLLSGRDKVHVWMMSHYLLGGKKDYIVFSALAWSVSSLPSNFITYAVLSVWGFLYRPTECFFYYYFKRLLDWCLCRATDGKETNLYKTMVPWNITFWGVGVAWSFCSTTILWDSLCFSLHFPLLGYIVSMCIFLSCPAPHHTLLMTRICTSIFPASVFFL